MISFGTALKSREHPYHRMVVLSDPATNDGWVVLVRVTTHDGTWPDTVCIVTPADWPQLAHDSTVAYSTAKTGRSTEALLAAIRAGLFDFIPSPSTAVLGKMVALGKAYSGTPPLAKKWMA